MSREQRELEEEMGMMDAQEGRGLEETLEKLGFGEFLALLLGWPRFLVGAGSRWRVRRGSRVEKANGDWEGGKVRSPTASAGIELS